MIGKIVGHIHNDNARGIVLTTGESVKGKAFRHRGLVCGQRKEPRWKPSDIHQRNWLS